MERCNTVCLLRLFISLSVFSLPFVICNGYADDAYINLSECQMKSCSYQADVHCVLQQMHYPCLPGMTKDTFIDKDWPGKARNLTGIKMQVQNKWRGEFSWKPPYDSSIHSLKGFQLNVNIQTEYSLGTPYCFYANITNKNWTEWHNAYDTVFNFNCIESSKPLNIHLQVVSIPKPSSDWQVVETELYLPRIETKTNLWDVNITWTYKQTSKGARIRVEFSPLYPGAEYHFICLSKNENICQYSSNIRVPENSETFEHLPFNSTYTINIRPRKTTRTFMLSHLYQKTIHIPAASLATGSLIRNVATVPHANESTYQAEPTMSSVAELPYPDDTSLKLGALISVSLVLIVAIIGTVFFFFHRGQNFKFCGVPEQPVQNHNCTSNHEGLNNIPALTGQADIGYKVPITLIYFPESSYFNNCVKSFASFINKIHNMEAHVVELNSRKLQIEQFNGENVVLILSDLTYLQNKDVIPMMCNNRMVHISAVVSFLPIMNIDLKEYQESYYIIAENIHVDQEYRCQYREDDIQNLILTLFHHHNSEETSLMSVNYGMPESRRLLSNILELCQSMLSASKLPTIPYHQHHADIVQSVITQNGYHCQQLQNHGCIQHSPTRTTYVQNGCPQRMLHSNGVAMSNGIAMSNGTVHFERPQYQLDEKIPREQKVKFTEDDYADMVNHDSGFSSLPSEQVPFLVHGGSDFLPPESEFGSIEMLEQRMLELNQRSNSHW